MMLNDVEKAFGFETLTAHFAREQQSMRKGLTPGRTTCFTHNVRHFDCAGCFHAVIRTQHLLFAKTFI